jgi:hypothetical protein
MKSKSFLYLAIVTVLSALAGYFIYKRNATTIDPTKISFAVIDPSIIHKIVITEPNKVVANLEKNEKGKWIINGLYPCRNDNMKVLLDGIAKMRIKYPVPNGAINNVIKDIATLGIKVEIYDNSNEMIKAYYIGRETQDMAGNNALLINHENGDAYEVPIVIEIPGFNGYLSPRFFADMSKWRDLKIFETQISELKKIEFKNNEFIDSSYVIEHLDNNLFSLKKLSGESIVDLDTNTLQRYLIYYREGNVLSYLKDQKTQTVNLDSIEKTAPFAEITITKTGNVKQKFDFFKQPINKEKYKDVDSSRISDPENVLVRINEPKEFAIAQFTNLGKWLQTWKYFLREKPVKKF